MNSFYMALVLYIITLKVRGYSNIHEMLNNSNATEKTEILFEQKNSTLFGSYTTSKKKRDVSGNDCESGWHYYENMCYKTEGVDDDDWLTFAKAEEFCEKEGGYLVSIHSAALNRFLYNLVKNSVQMRAWIGLHDKQNETEFKWIDETTLDFTNWAEKEPSATSGHLEEDCAEMYYPNYGRINGQWNDLNCDAKRPFICQKTTEGPCLPTMDNPCNSKGICEERNDKKGYECKCNDLFSGKTCEHNNPCLPTMNNSCNNQGVCKERNDKKGYECKCSELFAGKTCHYVNHCLPTMNKPCNNKGVCQERKRRRGYECKCNDLFSGNTCEHHVANANVPIAGIIGGVIGSVLAVLIIVAAFKFGGCKRKKKDPEYVGFQNDK